MLVVDTSAVLSALADARPPDGLVERLGEDGDLHAPHLIDVELLHAIRRLNLARELSDERARDLLADFAELRIIRYPHEAMRERIWQLRHNLTTYDGAFVALAEMLGAPLATCDARLSGSTGHGARLELFPPGPPQ